MLLLLTCCATACLDDGEENDKSETIRLTVASEMADYMTTGWSTSYLTEGILVKPDKSTTWENWSAYTIGNFYYEEGYEYELEVKKTVLANPPADGPDTVYSLIRILSQKEDKRVPYSERFTIHEMDMTIEGDSLTLGEMKEIKAQVLESLKGLYLCRYKFTYTDEAHTCGKIFVYLGGDKQEGTFEKSTEEWDGQSVPAYTFHIDGKTTRYLLTPYGGKDIPLSHSSYSHALREDLTRQYKAAYPAVKAVYSLQLTD